MEPRLIAEARATIWLLDVRALLRDLSLSYECTTSLPSDIRKLGSKARGTSLLSVSASHTECLPETSQKQLGNGGPLTPSHIATIY